MVPTRSGNFSRKKCPASRKHKRWLYRLERPDPLHFAHPLSRLQRPLLLTAPLPAFGVWQRDAVRRPMAEQLAVTTVTAGISAEQVNVAPVEIVLCFHGAPNIF
ncbi:hypothetical protein P8452_14980 [Trifolium repens]|nr:hypothetical protein P8452_14980 [Trifolium repens]